MAGASVAGIAVTPETAMQVSTVMACVKVIADGCAAPELKVYRENPDGTRSLAVDVPEYRLLNRRPNEFQTSIEFRRTMTMHAALTGNAIAVKVMRDGRVAELIPVRPGNCIIRKVGRYDLVFSVHDEFGLVGHFDHSQVIHLPCWQADYAVGMPAVRLAASSIGLAVASEKSQAALHENGGRPAGLLSTEQKLSEEAITRLRDAWRDWLTRNRNGTAIMDQGIRYTPLAMSAMDSQHLETRRFQVEEICRAFGVFPIMIGHSDKAATFASSEAFFAAHLKHTLAPWHQLWTQRLDEFMLDGDGPLFAEFDTRYLVAGSMRDRAAWARTMTEMGIYTRNEIRDEDGKDPLPGLDDPLTPLNMTRGEMPEGEENQDDRT